MGESNGTLLEHCKKCKEPIHTLIRETPVVERECLEMAVSERSGIHVVETMMDYGITQDAVSVWKCDCGHIVTDDPDEAESILMLTVTDLNLLQLKSYPLDVLVELKSRGYMIGRPQDGWELISSSYGDICNICGQASSEKVPSKDSIQERIKEGRSYPRGDYHCSTCEVKINEGCIEAPPLPFHSCDGDCDSCDANGTLHGKAAVEAAKNPNPRDEFNIGEIMCFTEEGHPHPTLGDRHTRTAFEGYADLRNKLEEMDVVALMPLYYDGKTLVTVTGEDDMPVGFTYTTWPVVKEQALTSDRGKLKGFLQMELATYNRWLTEDFI